MTSGCRVKIVSFSGIDGAGKTTQINRFESWLRQAGLRTRLFTFWDDVVVAPSFREFMSHKAFKGDQGIGSPEKPLTRRDKNVTSLPVTAMRFCLYLADAISLWLKVRNLRSSDADLVIFDRYIYDELANLPLQAWPARLFIRLVLSLTPKPDVAYIIDADPDAAFARKPEYPLEFLRSNREAYMGIHRLAGNITVIEPGPIEAGSRRIRETFLGKAGEQQAEFSGLPALQ